jgi:hypothetical protein
MLWRHHSATQGGRRVIDKARWLNTFEPSIADFPRPAANAASAALG